VVYRKKPKKDLKLHKRQPKRSPLTIEERDTLSDLDADIYRALIKDMAWVVEQTENAVIDFQYRPGKENELHHLKAKAMGAREFFSTYLRRIESLKG